MLSSTAPAMALHPSLFGQYETLQVYFLNSFMNFTQQYMFCLM